MASVIMPTKAMIAGRTASRVRVVSTDSKVRVVSTGSRVLEGLLKIQDTPAIGPYSRAMPRSIGPP